MQDTTEDPFNMIHLGGGDRRGYDSSTTYETSKKIAHVGEINVMLTHMTIECVKVQSQLFRMPYNRTSPEAMLPDEK